MRGLYSHSREYRKIFLRRYFPSIFVAKIIFTRCEYMPRLYSHPREYSKILLANYLCIGFVPGGKSNQIRKNTFFVNKLAKTTTLSKRQSTIKKEQTAQAPQLQKIGKAKPEANAGKTEQKPNKETLIRTGGYLKKSSKTMQEHNTKSWQIIADEERCDRERKKS